MNGADVGLHIEAWLDGELEAEAAGRFEEALRQNPALLDELELARSVRDTLRALPSEPVPADLVPGVLSVARREARRQAMDRVRSWLRGGVAADWRPFVAMAALILVVFGAVLVDRSARPERTLDPAVVQALEQVKWTLARVAEVGRRTGRTVRTDVLEPHVMEPVHGGVSQVFETVEPGARDDTIQ